MTRIKCVTAYEVYWGDSDSDTETIVVSYYYVNSAKGAARDAAGAAVGAAVDAARMADDIIAWLELWRVDVRAGTWVLPNVPGTFFLSYLLGLIRGLYRQTKYVLGPSDSIIYEYAIVINMACGGALVMAL